VSSVIMLRASEIECKVLIDGFAAELSGWVDGGKAVTLWEG